MQQEPQGEYDDFEDEEASEVSNKTVIRQGACMALLTIIFIGICTCHIFRNELLLVCCEKGYTTLANIFIMCGADVNAVAVDSNATPLLKATMNNHSETAVMLIRAGADINAKGDDGSTPLHWAAWDDHTQIANLLIEHKADVNAKDCDNRTPLTNAVENDNTDMAELFIENKANVNIKAPTGLTPLAWAAEKGHFHTAELLVKYGASINTKGKYDWTPLHLAAWNGHIDITKLLLNNGANVNALDQFGYTALDKASRPDVKKMLIEGGAKSSREVLKQRAEQKKAQSK